MKYWKRLCEMQAFSFMLKDGGVVRVKDSSGAWLERHKVQELVSSADDEIFRLSCRLEDANSFLKAGRVDIVRDILERAVIGE